MNKLKSNFNNFLPLNRKEKFYTATILPHLICYDNFKYFERFTSLIPGFPSNIEIKPNPKDNNILFLTEFSLTESLKDRSLNVKFQDVPKSKETPDLVVLITEPEKILIVVEAKMYSSSDSFSLAKQMDDQKKIINSIKKTLSINEKNIFHIGLVPSKMITKSVMNKYNIVYWEEILNAYRDILVNDYFFNVLDLALEKYDILVSKNVYGSTYGKNMDVKLSGLEIVKLHKEGKRFWVGRNRGLHGPEFQNDVRTGNWEKFEYEVNITASNPPNHNWFSSAEFINAVEKQSGSFSRSDNHDLINKSRYKQEVGNMIHNKLGDWHFSHLGIDYFLKIARTLGFESNLNAPIKEIYIGKSGVAYIEKLRGRKVNPNWAVILNSGEQKKYDNRKRKLEEGLWKRSNCNVYYWDEIKNFFRKRRSK